MVHRLNLSKPAMTISTKRPKLGMFEHLDRHWGLSLGRVQAQDVDINSCLESAVAQAWCFQSATRLIVNTGQPLSKSKNSLSLATSIFPTGTV